MQHGPARSAAVSLAREVGVGARDEPRRGVARLEGGEADPDRGGIGSFRELGLHGGEAPARLGERRERQHAEELVPAEADDEVVGPELRADRPGDALQHGVAGRVPAGVVDRLEPDDVDVDRREHARAPARPADLKLEIHHAGAPGAGPRERVGLRQLELLDESLTVLPRLRAVAGRLLAVARRPLAVLRRLEPGLGRGGAIGGGALACLRRPEHHLRARERLPPIRPGLLARREPLVAQLGGAVPVVRDQVPGVSDRIAGVGGLDAAVGGVPALPGAAVAQVAGDLVDPQVPPVLEVVVARRLVLIGRGLIGVGGGLVVVGSRGVGVGERLLGLGEALLDVAERAGTIRRPGLGGGILPSLDPPSLIGSLSMKRHSARRLRRTVRYRRRARLGARATPGGRQVSAPSSTGSRSGVPQDPSRPLALVTGASSGIGLELARELATHGFDLIVTAEDAELATAARELEGVGGARVDPVQADLARSEGVEELWAAVRRSGRPAARWPPPP